MGVLSHKIYEPQRAKNAKRAQRGKNEIIDEHAEKQLFGRR
jgi:hypothetical protein